MTMETKTAVAARQVVTSMVFLSFGEVTKSPSVGYCTEHKRRLPFGRHGRRTYGRGEWERRRGLHRFRFCVGRRQPVADGPTGGSVVGIRRRPRAPLLPTYAHPAAFTITPSGRRRRRLLYNTVPPPSLSTRYPFGVGLITGSSTSRIV